MINKTFNYKTKMELITSNNITNSSSVNIMDIICTLILLFQMSNIIECMLFRYHLRKDNKNTYNELSSKIAELENKNIELVQTIIKINYEMTGVNEQINKNKEKNENAIQLFHKIHNDLKNETTKYIDNSKIQLKNTITNINKYIDTLNTKINENRELIMCNGLGMQHENNRLEKKINKCIETENSKIRNELEKIKNDIECYTDLMSKS